VRRFGTIFSVVAAALALSAGAGIIHAQYPSPVGSVTASTNAVVAPAGSSTTLTCQVNNAAGAPIAGAGCTFSIVSEPGTDAAVGSKVITKITDASGQATTNLYTGSTPGVIVVRMDSGQLSSTVLVQVTGSAAAAAPPPAAPVSIAPPSTGDGGLR